MIRRNAIIAGLLALLLAALFFFFVWQPRSDEIAELEADRENVLQQQAQLRDQIQRLKEVRQNAAEAEAQIVAAETIVPRDLAIPAALRQLVLAADESGAELVSTTWSRPQQLEDAQPGLASISVGLQVNGGYYQIVDFLRRVEDPAISPRGFIWSSLSLAPDEYPTLSANISGTVYSLLPTPPAPEPEPTATPSPGAEDEEGTEEATP